MSLLSPLTQLAKKASSNASKINRIFEQNPITANAITGFITFAAGDVVSRGINNNMNDNDSVDSSNTNNSNTRTLLTGVLGAFMNGIILTGWYVNLDKIIGNSMNNKRQILMKCLCDQFLYSPLAIVVFFGHSSFFNAWNYINKNSNNKKNDDIYTNSKQVYNKDNTSVCSSTDNADDKTTKFIEYATIEFNTKMTYKFFDAYLADCAFWPLLNWLNFRYLPLHFRPSLVAVAQFFWQAILSTINSSERKTTTNKKEEELQH